MVACIPGLGLLWLSKYLFHGTESSAIVWLWFEEVKEQQWFGLESQFPHCYMSFCCHCVCLIHQPYSAADLIQQVIAHIAFRLLSLFFFVWLSAKKKEIKDFHN